MIIEKAWTTSRQGYPILHLVIDGRSAYVCEPKLTLLERGIVVLLDDENFWYQNISAAFQDNGQKIRVPGGTEVPGIVAIVRRFVQGETGNLLG